jgi:hypothetical protein
VIAVTPFLHTTDPHCTMLCAMLWPQDATAQYVKNLNWTKGTVESMIDTYWYLATVYRKHEAGLDAAAEEAARYAAAFTDAGIPVFAPIPHGHAIAKHSQTSPDAQFWADLQFHFMRPAYGLIVVRMDHWNESSGIKEEIKFFTAARRPIIHVNTDDPVRNFRVIERGISAIQKNT